MLSLRRDPCGTYNSGSSTELEEAKNCCGNTQFVGSYQIYTECFFNRFAIDESSFEQIIERKNCLDRLEEPPIMGYLPGSMLRKISPR